MLNSRRRDRYCSTHVITNKNSTNSIWSEYPSRLIELAYLLWSTDSSACVLSITKRWSLCIFCCRSDYYWLLFTVSHATTVAELDQKLLAMLLQVSSLLLSIAANFDKVAILCHKEGCDGMLDRWPLDFQSRVHVFDGAQIDPMFTDQVDNVRKMNKVHEFLVTMSHVHVANTLFTNFTDDETSSYLFLEEDYEVVQPKEDSGMSLNNSASNIARFVENDESWQFLRLGYNPANWQTRTEALRCKSSCMCQTVFDGICSITPGKFGNKALCWVGSTVGYAVHRRAWPALQKLEIVRWLLT